MQTQFGPALCLLALALLVSAVAAQSQTTLYPPNSPNPTPVYLSLHAVSISKPDPVENVFTADIRFMQVWYDPSASPNSTSPTYVRGASIWNPSLTLGNARSITAAIPAPLDRSMDPCPSNLPLLVSSATKAVQDNSVAASGCVKSSQRWTGTFSANLVLLDFPFDKQVISFVIESTVYDASEVQLIPTPDLLASFPPPSGWSINEWDVTSVTYSVLNNTYGSQTTPFPQMQIDISISRQSTFYVQKIIMVTCLTVLLGLGLFSLASSAVQRVQGSFSVVLALISMQWVLGASAPRLPYMTRIDRFMVFNFFFIFVTFHIQVGLYLFKSDKLAIFRCLGEDPNAKPEKKASKAGGEGDSEEPKAGKSKEEPASLPLALTNAIPSLLLDSVSRMNRFEMTSREQQKRTFTLDYRPSSFSSMVPSTTQSSSATSSIDQHSQHHPYQSVVSDVSTDQVQVHIRSPKGRFTSDASSTSDGSILTQSQHSALKAEVEDFITKSKASKNDKDGKADEAKTENGWWASMTYQSRRDFVFFCFLATVYAVSVPLVLLL